MNRREQIKVQDFENGRGKSFGLTETPEWFPFTSIKKFNKKRTLKMIENSSMTNTHPNSSAEKCKPWFSSLLAVVLSKKMNFISHRQSSSGTKWPGRKK